ncbi:MAG: transglutaminase TgpA family protein [Woeseiaceae bacterium]
MTKARGTDGSLLVSLPWTLASLLLAIAPHLQYLPIWISVAFVACAVWRYVIEQRRGALPSPWIRAGLALACFLGVLYTYSSISGVGPGSALLAVMAALKLLETRKRRDQFVLLFISIFLVMSSLLREQYLWSLPYLVFAVLLIMTAWLRMSAARQETAKHSFQTSGRLILYALPLAMAMWVFFPRIATPFWAVPIDTSAGTSGLSETMSPGDISSLSLSDELAFRVKFDGPVPAPKDRYWRGLVLNHFSGRTWSGNEPAASNSSRQLQRINFSGEALSYRITAEPTRQHWVFALDLPYAWTLDGTTMGTEHQLSRKRPIDQRIAYDVTSHLQYQSDIQMSDAAKNWYSRLPPEGNPRTIELAQQMFMDAGSAPAYIDAVLQKFHREEYYYTLEPPALGRNPVDSFLFETQRGFCEHYASAFAFMMRAAGIPSRIVLGYQGGEMNPQAEHLIVRQSDAHAWTEVWVEGSGWQRVDPTSAVAPQRIDSGMRGSMISGAAAAWGFATPSEFLHSLKLSWDAINAKWNDLVLGYGPENQDKLMRLLGMAEPDWQKKMLTLLGIVMGLILLISVLLMMRYRAPRPDKAAILYRNFVRKTGVEIGVGESPTDFAARAGGESSLSEEVIDVVTEAYLAARYGPPNPTALDNLSRQIGRL